MGRVPALSIPSHRECRFGHVQDEDLAIGGDVALNFTDVIISDPAGNSIPAQWVNGSVSIGLTGDVNSDGAIDILDVVNLVNYIIMAEAPDDYQSWAGDINGDADLNILDVVQLVNLILYGETF